jgi:hypothetical protein
VLLIDLEPCRPRNLTAGRQQARPSNVDWGTLVDCPEDGIEAAQAAEAGADCDFGHGQLRIVEEALGTLHSRRLRNLYGARADVSPEEAAQVARPNSQSVRQRIDTSRIEGSVPDQSQRSLDSRSRSFPCR